MRLILISAFVGSGVLGLSHMAWADAYSYQTLDVPGANMTVVSGINDSGQTVGTYFRGSNQYGFLESNGVFTTLPFNSATAINDSGQILAADGGILAPTGMFTSITVPPGTIPRNPYGTQTLVSFDQLNNAGQIVGSYGFPHFEGQITGGVFLYNNGTFTVLQPPDGLTFTPSAAINNSGRIIGSLTDLTGNVVGFIDDNGNLTTFALPVGGLNLTLTGLNDSDKIVGYSCRNPATEFFCEGFLIASGDVTFIDFPGASETYLAGINNEGQIVGRYYGTDGVEHGFIATPVPEPASLTLAGFGLLGGLGLILRRSGKRVGYQVRDSLKAGATNRHKAPSIESRSFPTDYIIRMKVSICYGTEENSYEGLGQ